jgi:hypothetical protein
MTTLWSSPLIGFSTNGRSSRRPLICATEHGGPSQHPQGAGDAVTRLYRHGVLFNLDGLWLVRVPGSRHAVSTAHTETYSAARTG